MTMNTQPITHTLTPAAPLRCLTLREVAALLGLSVVTLWRLRRRHDFPKPIRLSPGRIGFLESDIAAWLEARRS